MHKIFILIVLLISGLAVAAPNITTLGPEKEKPTRYLSSDNKEEDLQHYKKLERSMGVDIGTLIPMGDFQKEFSMAPLLGIHMMWQAIDPFAFTVSTMRASSSHKSGAAFGKLTVSSIAVGTMATFWTGRWMPFIKIEGALDFNDVSFDATRVITTGNDTFITTIGFNAGLGWDFIVGRELSLGVDAKYHYAVPKKLTLSDGTSYDIGSSYVTASFRVNF